MTQERSKSSVQPIITLAGAKVALGPMRRDLIPIYHAWISNLETTQYLSEAGSVVTLDEEIAWYERLLSSPSERNFTIYTVDAWQPIGTINLHQISPQHRKANMGIMIGETSLRGKGYGTEAVELVLDVGFNAMGLHSIWLTTHEFNVAGQKAYAKAGFREVGRRRQCRWAAGRYWDEIHMDILASEFTGSRLASRLDPALQPPEVQSR